MKSKEQFKRRYEMAKTGSKELGPLALLPGKWKGNRNGWNMIALPFDGGLFKFRILMNQYDETLDFTFVGDNVENRGLEEVLENSNNPPGSPEDDQFVVTLDYQQSINQRVAEDNPDSGGLAGSPKKPDTPRTRSLVVYEELANYGQGFNSCDERRYNKGRYRSY